MPTAIELGREFSTAVGELLQAVDFILEVWAAYDGCRSEILHRRTAGSAPDTTDAPIFVRLDRRHSLQVMQTSSDDPANAWKPRSEWAALYFRAFLGAVEIHDRCAHAHAMIDICQDILSQGHPQKGLDLFSDLASSISRLQAFASPRTLGLDQHGAFADAIGDLPADVDSVVERLRTLHNAIYRTVDWPVPAAIVSDPELYVYPRARAVFFVVGDCVFAAETLARALKDAHRVIDALDVERNITNAYFPASSHRSRVYALIEDDRTRHVWHVIDEYFRSLGRFSCTRQRLRQCCDGSRLELDGTSTTTELTTNHFLKHLSAAGPFTPNVQVVGHYIPMDAKMPTTIRAWKQDLDDMGEQIRHVAFARVATAVISPLSPIIRKRDLVSASPNVVSVFQPDGQFWRITFAGNSGLFAASVGIRYIAALLKHPNPKRPIEVQELTKADPRAMADEYLPDPSLDDQYLNDAHRRIVELDSDIEEGRRTNDTTRVEVAENEKGLILTRLAGDRGLGDRVRASGGKYPSAKAMAAVRQALSRAYQAMRDAVPSQSALADHLSEAIRAEGNAFAYRPGGVPPTWDFGDFSG
ncbi:MAG: hypothetical protein GIKADHBN_03138 [Phycisphaerales bacterium]|nr:hypothetical protein [Phycisphaerales bacterium]